MMKNKKVTVCLALFLALCISLALAPFAGSSAYAYDGLPGEFGAASGQPFYVAAADKTYVNYEGGYVVYSGDVTAEVPSPTAAEKHIGGRNMGQDGNEITSENIRDFIVNKGNFTIGGSDLLGVKLIYGSGWTDTTQEYIVNKFKDKFTSLYDGGYVSGVPCSTIGPWDNNEIKMEFRYGDSKADPDTGSGGKKNVTVFVYNVLDDEIRLVNEDKIWQKYSGEQRRLGAPITETTTLTIYGQDGEGVINLDEQSAMTVKAQIYETGIIYIKENGDAQKLEGLPIKRGDKWEISAVVKDQDVRSNVNGEYKFIGDVDGTWHPLKTARATVNSDNTINVYYNFLSACIEVKYNADYSKISAMRYSGYNFVKNEDGGYEKAMLPVENFTYKDELLWEGVESSALSYYQTVKSGGTEDDLKAAFKAGYIKLAESGFAPGYRCSSIKLWDLIVLDFKYGDGTTGFSETGSGGRERMTTLVYSPLKANVYWVYGEYFNVFKNDSGIGRKVTGAPISEVLTKHSFDGKTYEEIQFYEQGYLYKENGNLKSVVGITAYDDNYSVKSVIPAPEVPGEYGAKMEEQKSADGRTTYINYRYGAVKAVQNKADNACVYDYYSGRNFNFEDGDNYLDLSLLPVSDFLGENGEKLTQKDASAEYQQQFENVIKPLIVSEYTKYYNQGLFLGFPEGKFGDWNGCDGMQFKWGDSTANPFNDGRNHIALLAYNKTGSTFQLDGVKDKADELYLVKDVIMYAWASSWIYSNGINSIVGVPVSNEYTIEGSDAVFQNFKSVGGTTINLVVAGTSMGVAYYTDGTTAQQYIDAQKTDIPSYPDGKIPDTDVTVKEEYQEEVAESGCTDSASAAAALSALGVIAFVFIRRKF